ncbi:MAG TPA: hypothetical protein VG387_19635 [Rhizomicrobium sp.]|nr:hypothetical protein [Rhizomicrobium sp.]
MALFPRIQSPCPYRDDLAAIMDGDMCRMCKRQVVDITAFSDAQRAAFFDGCKGEVCVSYRLPARAVIAAAALAAAAALPTAASACDDTVVIYAGGITAPHNVQMVPVAVQVFTGKDAKKLPVVYDDKPAPKDDAKPVDKTTKDKP